MGTAFTLLLLFTLMGWTKVSNGLNPCLVHPVALAINKKNETPLFATVFVVLSTLHYYMFRPT
jgi:hypothetical protein